MVNYLRIAENWIRNYTTGDLIIAGPCAAETEKQVIETGLFLQEQGNVNVIRAGVWKPRTRPGTFEGAREKALPWLKKLKEETKLKVITEVARASHVDAALEAGIDMIWIGARTTGDPFSVDEIADRLAGVDIPVFVKNPLHPDPDLWIGAIERFLGVGITRIAAIHRGFYPYISSEYRNIPLWDIPLKLMKNFPNLPVLCDPSHIAGRADLVKEIACQAQANNMAGLMIEVHPRPIEALSDAMQQLDFKSFSDLMKDLYYK